jgi:hypothetical protein
MRNPAWLILLLACACRSSAIPSGPSGSGGVGYSGDLSQPHQTMFDDGPPLFDLAISGASDGGAQAYGLLLFGGFWQHGALNDTWLWDGSTWTALTTLKPATAAANASAASIASGVLLFEGSQTWIWRGAWTQLATTEPPARWRAAMARRGASVVLYGGEVISNPTTGVFHDAWQWNGNWTQIAAPPLANSDMGSWTCTAMTALGSDVIVPGIPTWRYDGTQWTQASANGPPPSRQCVAAQFHGDKVLVYTTPTDCSASPQTWVWDGHDWTQLSIFAPSYRTDTAMATEPNGKVLLFGGADCSGAFLGDTWEFDGTKWTALEVESPPPRYGAAMAAF